MMQYEIGDHVKFEVSPVGLRNTPRWDWNVDTGKSSVWAIGKITSISNTKIEIEYTIKGYIGAGICEFPNHRHVSYSPAQWCYPGYMYKLINADKADVVCECGAATIKTTHSTWCPAY